MKRKRIKKMGLMLQTQAHNKGESIQLLINISHISTE